MMSQVDLSGKPVSDASPSFPGDFPVNRSLSPGSGEARQMTVTSGRRCSGLCRSSGPLGSLERMLLGSSAWDSTLRLLTWTVRATPAGRSLFRLSPSEPCTSANGASLLPTPDTAPEAPNASQNRIYPKNLLQAARDGYIPKIWQTPRGHETEDYQRDKTGRKTLTLTGQVKMVPTPTANDADNATLPPGAGKRDSLPGYLIREGASGKLNVLFVEWLMGFPAEWTALPASAMPSSRNRSTRSSGRSRISKGDGSE